MKRPFGSSLRCIDIILLMSMSSALFGHGAWFKDFETSNLSKNRAFKIVMVKVGIFSKDGRLKRLGNLDLSETCKNREVWGWITHRRGPTEILSPEAGHRLATEVNSLLKGSCLSGIEIDLEPLQSPLQPWVSSFFKGVKITLDPKVKLRLALAALSEKPLKGPFWTSTEMDSLLESADGIDLMLYDTGLQNVSDYRSLVKNAMAYASKKVPEKSVYLGLPAYDDKTMLHRLGIESTENAIAALREMPFNCAKGVSVIYFAGWTISEPERNIADSFQSKWSEHCAVKH